MIYLFNFATIMQNRASSQKQDKALLDFNPNQILSIAKSLNKVSYI